MKKKIGFLLALLLICSLSSICLANGIKYSDKYNFRETDEYTYHINDDRTVTIISYKSSKKENSIFETIKIPSKLGGLPVTTLGNGSNHVFSNYENLKSVIIPDSVTTINTEAFYKCPNLETIEIPNSVTTIAPGAFRCGWNIVVSPDNENYATIDRVLFNKKDKSLIYYTGGTSYQVPDGILSIGDEAFYDKDGLESIVIPDSVTEIGKNAFEGCNRLANIQLSNSLTKIGKEAFAKCGDLTNIVIPASVKKIGKDAFLGCWSLNSITVSSENENYTSIDNVLINKKDNMLICYPQGLTAFSNYRIPDGIVSIGDRAFNNCRLTSIEIPDSVTEIGEGAFSESSLESINIPNSITAINADTFNSCTYLSSIQIPSSVTTIGDRAFRLCSGLSIIEIPDSVTTIGEEAFAECGCCRSIVIPDSVTKIGATAFNDPSAVLTLTVGSDSYAKDYAENYHIPYTYADANDWLNS